MYPGFATIAVSYFTVYYYSPEPPAPTVIDERCNPKMWAVWFQEFLEELLGAGRRCIKEARQRHPLLSRIERHCRSNPLQRCEWVFKLWKQAL